MERLYARFPLGDEHLSVSMTINGPAPIILAMYVAAAQRRFGRGVVPKLRGTVQADRSEEHTSELQSRRDLVCRLLLEKKKTKVRAVLDPLSCYKRVEPPDLEVIDTDPHQAPQTAQALDKAVGIGIQECDPQPHGSVY